MYIRVCTICISVLEYVLIGNIMIFVTCEYTIHEFNFFLFRLAAHRSLYGSVLHDAIYYFEKERTEFFSIFFESCTHVFFSF